MKRDVSTSTVGRDEVRQQLMTAYMFERRILLGCSLLMVVSLIMWIVAISTDHWIMISGDRGIFIPETRRFFISSHSGLWRHCRYTVTPYPLPSANVVRNFTSIAYQNPAILGDAKTNVSQLDFIRKFREQDVVLPLQNFTEQARQRMFSHWVLKEESDFEMFKREFEKLVLLIKGDASDGKLAEPIEVNPLDVDGIEAGDIFGPALQKVAINSSLYYFVIPENAQLAIFQGWNEHRYVPKLLWPYVRDLGVAAYVVNDDNAILLLVPPLPPKSGKQSNGYDYVANRRCKYIEMFPNANSMRNEPGFDDTLMDYIRTQASFACITVFVMALGAVFSFYTFMNPRYMFKRLAGGIHLVSASTAVVVIQVLLASYDYTKEHLFYAYPARAELSYGYGVILAWFTFGANLLCGFMFIWYSGKKKGSKAPTDELAMADEPTIMGR